MSSDNVERREGKLYIALESYLVNLAERLPADRRGTVPTIRELAKAVGIHEVTLHNIAKGRIKQLNLETAQRIMDEMNRRGFDMEIRDFIRYVPPGN